MPTAPTASVAEVAGVDGGHGERRQPLRQLADDRQVAPRGQVEDGDRDRRADDARRARRAPAAPIA